MDVLIGEPYFQASTLPWHDLHFWYARTALAHRLNERAYVIPQSATMRAIAVDFEHLWKIRAPIGICEGFDISHFDDVIKVRHNIYNLACVGR